MKIKRLELNCLANLKLKKWYEMLGFIYIRTIYTGYGIPKVYKMIKNI